MTEWNADDYAGWPIADAADAAWESVLAKYPKLHTVEAPTLRIIEQLFQIGFTMGGQVGLAQYGRTVDRLFRPTGGPELSRTEAESAGQLPASVH